MSSKVSSVRRMTAWFLNMQPTDCAETSVVSCQPNSCNILKNARACTVQQSRFSFCLGFRSRDRAFRLAVTSFPAVTLYNWRHSKGRFTHSMPCPCRSPAFPLACRALIHTCHAESLPCSDSAVSFVEVGMVAGNIRTASPTV